MRFKLPDAKDPAAFEQRFTDEVWRDAAAIICARHSLVVESLRRSPVGENVIFFTGGRFVIKIYAPLRAQHVREKAALEFAQGKLCIETPEVVLSGELDGWPYLIMTRLTGLPMREVWPDMAEGNRTEIVSHLGAALKELHAHAAPLAPPELNRDWREFVQHQAQTCVERQRACGANPEWLASLPTYIAARLELLPTDFEPVMLHGDVHPGNVLLVEKGGRWQASALFDFGDSFCGFREYEFVAPGVLMVQGCRAEQKALLLAYGYTESQLDLNLRARLMLLTILYECSDLRKYALRLAPDATRLTLDELEAAIWTFAAD